jgi:hypothetical protein
MNKMVGNWVRATEGLLYFIFIDPRNQVLVCVNRVSKHWKMPKWKISRNLVLPSFPVTNGNNSECLLGSATKEVSVLTCSSTVGSTQTSFRVWQEITNRSLVLFFSYSFWHCASTSQKENSLLCLPVPVTTWGVLIPHFRARNSPCTLIKPTLKHYMYVCAHMISYISEDNAAL